MFERPGAARGSGQPPPNLLSELSLCPGFHYRELHGDEHSCTHVCLPSAVHRSPAPHSTVASEHFLGHSCLDFSEHFRDVAAECLQSRVVQLCRPGSAVRNPVASPA